MQEELSPKIRRLRLEALAQSLRPFGLVDDGRLSILVAKSCLPDAAAFAKAIRISGMRLPPTISADFVASSLLVRLREIEADSASFEDLFLPIVGAAVTSAEGFHEAVMRILQQFKISVEMHKGYRFLWEGHVSKSEKDAQALFAIGVRGWCRAFGLDFQSEVNLGRGPVDFRLSDGANFKAVIEMKLARHKDYWDGINVQLPIYMAADDIQKGYFVTIVYTDSEWKKLSRLEEVLQSVRRRVGYQIYSIVVDARFTNKQSASKMKQLEQ